MTFNSKHGNQVKTLQTSFNIKHSQDIEGLAERTQLGIGDIASHSEVVEVAACSHDWVGQS